MDTDVENSFSLSKKFPLQVGEQSIIWLEATTTNDNTVVSGRFTLLEYRDIDA